jgi:hypothetical protein
MSPPSVFLSFQVSFHVSSSLSTQTALAAFHAARRPTASSRRAVCSSTRKPGRSLAPRVRMWPPISPPSHHHTMVTIHRGSAFRSHTTNPILYRSSSRGSAIADGIYTYILIRTRARHHLAISSPPCPSTQSIFLFSVILVRCAVTHIPRSRSPTERFSQEEACKYARSMERKNRTSALWRCTIAAPDACGLPRIQLYPSAHQPRVTTPHIVSEPRRASPSSCAPLRQRHLFLTSVIININSIVCTASAWVCGDP